MTLEPVACNACGAALEVAAGSRYVTCERCGRHLAVRRAAGTRFTEETAADAADRLAELARRAELELLDREWEIERGRFVSHPNHGAGRWGEPNGVAALAGGAAAAGFGVLWVWLALTLGAPAPLTLLGMAFVLTALTSGVYGWARAGQYWSAKRAYESRRAAVDHDPVS